MSCSSCNGWRRLSVGSSLSRILQGRRHGSCSLDTASGKPFWTIFLLMTCLGGVVGFAFWYVTDSETVAALIHSQGKRFLPGSDVIVGRVRSGRCWVRSISNICKLINPGSDLVPALRFPWAKIEYNARAMLKGKFGTAAGVVIAQPTLRLKQRKDGSWNLQRFLARPGPVR